MNRYNIIFEALQERVELGELTVEQAEVLNDIAYEKYVESYDEDEDITYGEYLEALEYEIFEENDVNYDEIAHKGSTARSLKALNKSGEVYNNDPDKIEKIYNSAMKTSTDRKRNLKAGYKRIQDEKEQKKVIRDSI